MKQFVITYILDNAMYYDLVSATTHKQAGLDLFNTFPDATILHIQAMS